VGPTSQPSRRTALFEEHVALGADMDVYAWSGMAMPWRYRTPLAVERRAVRERVGLADASQLQVVRGRGPGAAACLERLVPRRVDDMPPGTSRFSAVLSRFGRIRDEALIMRFSEREFWISHGCGGTQRQLAKLGGDVTVEPLRDQHALAVQGPLSLSLLSPMTDAPLGDLPPMGHLRAALGGRPVVVSRTGFTGELGFEIFCAAGDAVALWRTLRARGEPLGLVPYSYQCVDLLRVEAGFALYPFDLAAVASIWEAGLGWLVRDKAADFVGREATLRAKGAAQARLLGVRCPGEAPLRRGAAVRRGPRSIGAVTSSVWSPGADETLCIARVQRGALRGGAEVLLQTEAGPARARLARLPFRARRIGGGAG